MKTLAAILVLVTCMAVMLTLTATVARGQTDYVTRGLLCIHHYEGSWRDDGAPYWGGLQMDKDFERAYGRRFLRRWGHANHWPVWAQLQAGRNAVRVRGWAPWPHTRRLCGL